MEVKDLLKKLSILDDMEAPCGMNITEAEIKSNSLGDIVVNLNNIMNGGIVCRGNTFTLKGTEESKQIEFSFSSEMMAKPFKASLDNEEDPKEIAKQCAEIIKKHLDPMEDEIVNLLNSKGYNTINYAEE